MTTPPTPFPTLEEVEDQERRLVLPSASPADLYRLGRRAADTALAEGLGIVVQVRVGDRVVFMAAAPGSAPLNDHWAARKARTVRIFEQSTMRVRLAHEREGTDMHTRHSLPEADFAAHGGGFPLRVAGTGCIGSFIVSGLPQTEDHAFLVRILEEHLAAG
jgi:uncharacterized protein (UPF0303 family)